MMPINSTKRARPFLRWAGGKTRSAPILAELMPLNDSNIGTYYEPFLGAASLFFRLTPQVAVLSDSNKGLIDCYRSVREDPVRVARLLWQQAKKTSKDYYYECRQEYNQSPPSVERAALFIYLNKTCFNGIWRVNHKGQFNVPYGYKQRPALPTEEELIRVSEALAAADIYSLDYKDAVCTAREGDFIYFDPPYPPLNGTSYFTHYTKERFTNEDHRKLAVLAKELTEKGCYVLISNSDTECIRSLYADFNILELEVVRWIRTDGKRYKAKEIAITNYPTPKFLNEGSH